MEALRQGVRFVWEHGRNWIVATILFTILLGLAPVVTLWVSKELINAVSDLIQNQSQNTKEIMVLLGLQFMIAVLVSLMNNFQGYMDRKFEVHLDHSLNKLILNKTGTVPLAYFDLPVFHNHLQRIQGTQGTRFLSPVRSAFGIAKALLTVVSFLFYLFTVHWGLVVVSLVSAVPIFFIQKKFGGDKFNLMFSWTPQMREVHYTGHLLQDRQVAKEIRLFGLVSYLITRWSAIFLKNSKESLRLMRSQQNVNVGLDSLVAFFYLGAAGIIIWLIQHGALRIGDFVAVGQAVQGTQNLTSQISSLLAKVYEESLYIQDFFRFLEYEEATVQIPNGTESFPVPLRSGISVENLSFSYPGLPRQVLRNVSLHIKSGEKVAIVGENGSGKTTLVKCLMGLYRITNGRICFDGVSLEHMDKRDLVKRMTVIFQDYIKYSFTLRENIAFGDIDRADDLERIEKVAKDSGVHDIVKRLKNGYETYLGRFLNDGEDLSEGQWQKIALSRALFREGEVIILDEPTAALDPKSEMEVFRQFDVLTQNKTAIFISHRMSAARMADRIVFMKHGEVAEVGTHEELIALKGEYARMYEMQAKWYV